jgi:hypothetical protein
VTTLVRRLLRWLLAHYCLQGHHLTSPLLQVSAVTSCAGAAATARTAVLRQALAAPLLPPVAPPVLARAHARPYRAPAFSACHIHPVAMHRDNVYPPCGRLGPQ